MLKIVESRFEYTPTTLMPWFKLRTPVHNALVFRIVGRIENHLKST